MIGDIAYRYKQWDKVFPLMWPSTAAIKRQSINQIFPDALLMFILRGESIPKVEYTEEEIGTW